MNSIAYVIENGSGQSMTPKATAVAQFLIAHPQKLHSRQTLAEACKFKAHSRACSIYIAEIRAALGDMRDQLICQSKRGYGLFGDPITLVPCAKIVDRKTPTAKKQRLVAMSQEMVAERLGITLAEVEEIEQSALKKLREFPDLRDAWHQMQREKDRVQYDPFHAIWLFSIIVERKNHAKS